MFHVLINYLCGLLIYFLIIFFHKQFEIQVRSDFLCPKGVQRFNYHMNLAATVQSRNFKGGHFHLICIENITLSCEDVPIHIRLKIIRPALALGWGNLIIIKNGANGPL